MSETISKISLKTCGAQPAKRSLKEGESRRLMIVYGRSGKYETTSTSTGDAEKFKGNFEAIHIESAKAFDSSAFYPPGELADILSDAIDAVKGPIDFSFELGAIYSQKGNLGYLYTVKPLRNITEADPLGMLRQETIDALGEVIVPPAAAATVKRSPKTKK